MAADVRAWRDGQPIGARRGTVRYRVQKFARRHKLGLAGAALLAVTLLAGVLGVLWQARVANQQRRKAEARSADLRQLSNSLLSELDEAIKDLPGSTGVQKLLVTRVLEHLDRMATDAQGDRQTQLDLVDAYTRLGNIQGNPYEQNLGDPSGGLASMDKAIALGRQLAPPGSTDRDALRDLALAQECRSEILFGAARTSEAIPSMREAVATYERVIAFPNATPTLIGDAAAAYGTLGDEFGQSGTSSLADSAAALVALRKAVDLDNRALSIDPGFLRARRGLSIMQMKIGSVEMETDPAQALKDFQFALERADELPQEQQGTLANMRMRSMLQRKEADALTELGQYAQAEALFHEVATAQKRLAANDPQDLRSLADVEVVLADEALSLEDAANPTLAAQPPDRDRNLAAAQEAWSEVVAATEKMLRQDPSNENWRLVLADAQVHLGTVETRLHGSGESRSLAAQGIATLQAMANKPEASPMILDQAASDLVHVEPASLQDPAFAVRCAERSVELSHSQSPSRLLALAQAYRAARLQEKGRAVALEALALLPATSPGGSKSNLRKLLELEAQPGK
jgi:tetratricopeptide (TPR) repeat protein